MSKYDDIIQAAAKQYNVDPALIRGVIATESSGKPNAQSGVGATGLMQIMPSNYKSLGITDPTDPKQNIYGGAQLLSQLLDRFGDVPTALTHYVGGDDPKQWGPQTAAYPGKVLAAAGIGAQQAPAAPATLPGIPTAQAAGAPQSDDAIFQQFAKGGATVPGQQDPQSDDAILSAFTKSAAPAAVAPKAQAAPVQVAGEQPGGAMSFLAGMGRGVQETALGAQQLLGHGAQAVGLNGMGDWLVNDANQGLTHGAQEVAPYSAAHPIATGAGNIAGSMAATAPLMIAAPAGTGMLGLATRGAVSGGLMGATAPVSPDSQNYGADKLQQVGIGSLLGIASPFAVAGAVGAGKYAGNALGSLVRPFTQNGQQAIARDIVFQAARGGPSGLDLSQIVPGSSPTLAEATANPGIATLQRTIRDLNPSPFVAQEQQNAAARLSALGGISGTPEELSAARLARTQDAADNYLATNVGIPTTNTAYAALKQTPAFNKAFAEAQQMAKNQGISSIETVTQNRANANMGGQAGTPQIYVSGQGLQYVKQSLDDQIDSAMRAGESGKARNVLGVKDQLLQMMDDNIDGYAQARSQFAQQSGPIDAMQYLQSLNLTDAQGNVTLAKVQNALSQMQKLQQKPGINTAKSVTPDQITALQSIRDDLLRASNAGLGRSAGSSTAQNLATQQMMRSVLPGKLGALAGQLPTGTVGGALGGLAGYGVAGAPGAAVGGAIGARLGSGLSALMNTHNEAIQSEVASLMLNPSMAAPALNGAAGRALPFASSAGLQRLLYPAIVNGGVKSLGGNGRPQGR
ncbi:lytic transglycosylase domain-containing protein [Paraburkholderia saeva]|uniref:Membrane-bound lytic murein transglycosylase F n=1 Tax=Paraburkholderia saeva TaxID=2777537 RepID=A0A9N8RW88_9BURK|nr:lytic transglycosylase domain-containing protein [Paraburkholderia saeva]CAG4900863.1 Membrane-bound lytic murein transglycosylase F [Paraburkholderia saeva]